jgi:TPR repeat protein
MPVVMCMVLMVVVQAFNLFKSLAEGGDEDSMHEVSQCYREGKGGTWTLTPARHRRACVRDPHRIRTCAVARDMEKAEYWLRKRQAALAENGGSAKAD